MNETMSNITFLIIWCHQCCCQHHMMPEGSSMEKFHLLHQDAQNETHDTFDQVMLQAPESVSCDTNGIITGTTAFFLAQDDQNMVQHDLFASHATGISITWCHWNWCHVMHFALVSALCDTDSIINGTTAHLLSKRWKQGQNDVFGHVMPLIATSIHVTLMLSSTASLCSLSQDNCNKVQNGRFWPWHHWHQCANYYICIHDRYISIHPAWTHSNQQYDLQVLVYIYFILLTYAPKQICPPYHIWISHCTPIVVYMWIPHCNI